MKRMIFLLFLAGCSLAPRYDRPMLDENPEDWRLPLDTENAVDLGWWKQFGDETLDQMIDQALANNQNLKVAMANVDAYLAQLGVARSQYWPQIQLNTVASREKISSSVTAVPTGVQQIFNTFGFLFQASYLVDLWGQVRNTVETAYQQWLASVEARRTVVLGLITSVANTYIQLRQFDLQLAISKRTYEDRKKALYLAQVRFDLGLTSKLEVEQAITEVQNAEMEIENLEIYIATTEDLLSVLLGQPSKDIQRGASLEKMVLPPAVPAILPSDIVNQRPDIKAVEHQLIAAGANIGVVRTQFFPQISLKGAFGYESIQMNTLFDKVSKNWAIGGPILQEIFTGWGITSQVEYAIAQQQQLLHQYLQTILTAFQEVNDALITHKINLEQVETQRINVEALKTYLRLSYLRYNEGQIDYLTYLDAERHLFEGELSYVAAIGASFVSYIQIYQALGGGWVDEADAEALCDQ